MLFLYVFNRIPIQFGGFSEQQQDYSTEMLREICHYVFTGKTSNFVSADATI